MRSEHRFSDDAVRAEPLTIANQGESDIEAVVTVTGVPTLPQPADANGLTVTRSYYTLQGEPVACT